MKKIVMVFVSETLLLNYPMKLASEKINSPRCPHDLLSVQLVRTSFLI